MRAILPLLKILLTWSICAKKMVYRASSS